MTNSRIRPTNWNTEDQILRDDMPCEFRNLLEETQKRTYDRDVGYAHALEGLGAMTYAVVIGTAAAQFADKRQLLWEALQGPSRKDFVRALDDKGEHYVQICGEALVNLLRTANPNCQLDGILRDIVDLDPCPSIAQVKEHFQVFREIGPGRDRKSISRLNNSLYDLVSALFGYWPNYSLGFLDAGKKPRVHFDACDTHELGELYLDASQAEQILSTHEKLTEQIARSRMPDRGQTKQYPSIDAKCLRIAFLADLKDEKIWMISPFVFNYSPNDSKSSEYIFLDPTWSNASDMLTWRRFNSVSLPADGRTNSAPRGAALVLKSRNSSDDWHCNALLNYPRGIQIDQPQVDKTFRFLENELKKVKFKIDKGSTYHFIGDKSPKIRKIFYKTNASLYFEVAQVTPSDDGNGGPKIAVAKMLRKLSGGREGLERERFNAEVGFLKAYFLDHNGVDPQSAEKWGIARSTSDDKRRIGTGIVRWWGSGFTHSDSSAFNNRQFSLHEHIEESLEDIIAFQRVNDLRLKTQEGPSMQHRLAAIRSARRMMQALYMTERTAATLTLIYKNTKRSDTDIHFIHRNIRPENLLYRSGTIKISNFSEAFFPHDNRPVVHVKDYDVSMQHNKVLDSYRMSSYYCAPEVYERPTVYSPTADVFSLGAVLNEMLFGRKKNVQRDITKWHNEHKGEEDWEDYLFDKPDDDIDEQVCKEIEEFADRNPGLGLTQNRGKHFDLARLVGSATCHFQNRLSMEEFLKDVAAANHLIRHYLADRCHKVIAEARESRSAASLQFALTCVSSVFGQDVSLKSPHAMVRCAKCFQCEQYAYDTPGRYPCDANVSMDNVIKVLQKAVEKRSWSGHSDRVETIQWEMADEPGRINISDQEASRVLTAVDEALQICPGIMDRLPGESDPTLKEKLKPHDEFHKAGFDLFKSSGGGDLSVISSDESEKPPTTHSALAAELLMLFAHAEALPDSSSSR